MPTIYSLQVPDTKPFYDAIAAAVSSKVQLPGISYSWSSLGTFHLDGPKLFGKPRAVVTEFPKQANAFNINFYDVLFVQVLGIQYGGYFITQVWTGRYKGKNDSTITPMGDLWETVEPVFFELVGEAVAEGIGNFLNSHTGQPGGLAGKVFGGQAKTASREIQAT